MLSKIRVNGVKIGYAELFLLLPATVSAAQAKKTTALDALETLQKATIDQTEQQWKSVYNINIPLRQGFAYITVRY